MNGEIAQISTAIVTLIAPFTPYLLEVGKATGQKWVETVAEKGGEAAWSRAKMIWEKIHSHVGDDPKVKGAALMVSADPEDSATQTLLVNALATHLNTDPQLMQELLHLLVGSRAVQEALADRQSGVEDVTQEIKGTGTQRVKASEGSIIKGVRQSKE
jgi:hypothetical protein